MEEKDYVTYEVAELLKSKGYNEPCNHYFRIYDKKFMESSGLLYNSDYINKEFDSNVVECTVPTLYEAHKWMREKYGMYVLVAPYHNSDYGKFLTFDIYRKIDCYPYLEYVNDSDDVFDSYEETLNVGIKKALNFI